MAAVYSDSLDDCISENETQPAFKRDNFKDLKESKLQPKGKGGKDTKTVTIDLPPVDSSLSKEADKNKGSRTRTRSATAPEILPPAQPTTKSTRQAPEILVPVQTSTRSSKQVQEAAGAAALVLSCRTPPDPPASTHTRFTDDDYDDDVNDPDYFDTDINNGEDDDENEYTEYKTYQTPIQAKVAKPLPRGRSSEVIPPQYLSQGIFLYYYIK